MATEARGQKRSAAGLGRAALVIAYAIIALILLYRIAYEHHWSFGIKIGLPVSGLGYFAYKYRPRYFVSSFLFLLSLLCVSVALAISFNKHVANGVSIAEDVWAMVGVFSIGAALIIYVTIEMATWRSSRVQLRRITKTPLERISGGF